MRQAYLHAKGFAHEGAFHLLPLNAQSWEGGVLPIALIVIGEVLDDWRGYDVANVLCILMLLHTQHTIQPAVVASLLHTQHTIKPAVIASLLHILLMLLHTRHRKHSWQSLQEDSKVIISSGCSEF